jgi:hypothetical protein
MTTPMTDAVRFVGRIHRVETSATMGVVAEAEKLHAQGGGGNLQPARCQRCALVPETCRMA